MMIKSLKELAAAASIPDLVYNRSQLGRVPVDLHDAIRNASTDLQQALIFDSIHVYKNGLRIVDIECKDGARHGRAWWRKSDGYICMHNYSHGKLYGKCVKIKDGIINIGYHINGIQHGRSISVSVNSIKTQTWIDGKRCGYGMIIEDGVIISDCYYNENKRHGAQRIYHDNGNMTVCKWMNGRIYGRITTYRHDGRIIAYRYCYSWIETHSRLHGLHVLMNYGINDQLTARYSRFINNKRIHWFRPTKQIQYRRGLPSEFQ